MLPAKRSQNWLPGVFDDFFGNEWISKAGANVPAINIKESDKAFTVELAAPGLKKEDFKIKIDDNNHLIIRVEKESSNEVKEEKYLRREFSFTQFQQTLILPDNIEKDKIEAKQENGVLSLVIPKMAAKTSPATKEIPVK